jgi:glycine reductase
MKPKNNQQKGEIKGMLKGKKVAILGDRDGIPGPAIEQCVKSAGAEVVFSTTECFV